MTNREFFTLAAASDNAEFAAKAKELLTALDGKNAKRAGTEKAKRAAENAPIIAAIKEYAPTAGKVVVASEIAAACGISTSKASALLRALTAEGYFTAADTKVKGKGTVKAYTVNA